MWEGEERRLHDRECGEKMQKCAEEVKAWVREHVCLTIKPTKIRNGMLWGAIITMLLTSGLSIVRSLADTGDIKYNEAEIEEVKDEHRNFENKFEAHLQEQRRVNEKILDSLSDIKSEVSAIKKEVQ